MLKKNKAGEGERLVTACGDPVPGEEQGTVEKGWVTLPWARVSVTAGLTAD